MGVRIPMSTLNAFNGSLQQIMVELDSLGGGDQGYGVASASNALSFQIGSPFDEHALQDAAQDLDGSWDEVRTKLSVKLYEVQQRVEGTVSGWQGFDDEAAADVRLHPGASEAF